MPGDTDLYGTPKAAALEEDAVYGNKLLEERRELPEELVVDEFQLISVILLPDMILVLVEAIICRVGCGDSICFPIRLKEAFAELMVVAGSATTEARGSIALLIVLSLPDRGFGMAKE